MRFTRPESLTQQLRKYKPFFDLLKRTTNDYLFMRDFENDMTLISSNMVNHFDLPGDVLLDFDDYWVPLIHPDEKSAFLAYRKSVADDKNVLDHEIKYRVKNNQGEYVWVHCRGRMGLSREGVPLIYAGIISRMANHNQIDEVTGLLNRNQFEQVVKLALSSYRLSGHGGAIMVLGLDNFHIINEAYNRMVGDMVMRKTASIIEKVVSPKLIVYKLDGDEFALVMPEADEAAVNELFVRIQQAVSQPQEIDGRPYLCTVSAGTVFYPEAGKDYLVLHKHAESALNIAKQGGKNKNCLFDKSQYNRWMRSLSMRDNLWDSVENNCRGFQLYFQPQVNASDKALLGAEALLRWHNPKGKMVAPMEFIPVLEETKLIIPVGKWVFEESVKVCKKWRRVMPNFKVSVNLSYEQVKDLSFQDFAMDCLKRNAMPPECVVLELTESKVVADWSFVNNQFDIYRRQGIAIAMDDFGTGYSSLSSLKNLSCDIVKIDREFVNNILTSEFDCQLVEHVVSLCHSIGISCCIEGVEEAAQYELLVNRCKADSIQGYLFGRPEPVEAFEEKFLMPLSDKAAELLQE